MADINYTNPEAIKPKYGWEPTGFLAGMNYAGDRARYEQQGGLADLMNLGKARDYVQDAPVRDSKRLSDIATNTAEAGTVQRRKEGEVQSTELANQYNQGTMGARIASTITSSEKGQHDFALQKVQQGMMLATQMMQALGQYGPAGASHVAQMMKAKGLDVENDPVVKHVLSASNPQEMQERLNSVYDGFNQANEHFRLQKQKGSDEAMVQMLRNQGSADTARVRTSQEKEYDEAVRIYGSALKQQHPDWPDWQVQAEALKQYQTNKYGVGKTETVDDKEGAAVLKELEKLYALVKPESDMGKRIKGQIDEIKGRKGKPQAGTRDNPIKLK